MKIISVTKHFSRKITDGNFGSIESGTSITIEEEILDTDENKKQKILNVSNTLFEMVKKLTDKDLKTYLNNKEKGEVL